MADYIYATNGLSREIVGIATSNSRLNSNSGIALREQFMQVNIRLIKPYQKYYANTICRKLFDLIADFTGVKELKDLAPKFPDRIQELFEALKEFEEEKAPGIIKGINDNNPDKISSRKKDEGRLLSKV